MKKLNRKVFKTIFIILSLFIITGIIVYNVSSYKKEYDNVKRNLTFMVERNTSKPEGNPPEPKVFNESIPEKDKELDNMMIMDYDVYSVILNNNEIERIINHSKNTSNFDIDNIAKKIVTKNKGLKIGNLYTNRYSYNYAKDTIVIINTKKINSRLLLTLVISISLLLGFEIIIYYISKKLTKRITKPAQESFDKQRDFIADASHELKTPLAVIMASSDELKSDKKNIKYIENIKYESERMNNLIKSLLDLSKLENGVSINNYKDENISKIIEKTSSVFDSIAYEQRVSIETNIEKDIIFKCSKDEIERLISILIDNAIKHSYKDSVIKVNLYKDKNSIIIEVINTGNPINPGDEEKIFERFYRADKSRNREANRYGLGLAIAKNIVNNHKGNIKAFSKDNTTTFKIILKK
ncbi:MAG: HAMP domain-containing histidine kinase [Bacilli bacterium]|nr:HAMP domain-containing histidine kinase [Bacilli bacterium]